MAQQIIFGGIVSTNTAVSTSTTNYPPLSGSVGSGALV